VEASVYLVDRVATACLLIVATACAHQPVPLDARHVLLDQREREFFATLAAASDADAMAGFFADDAVIHVANMPAIEGRSAIREFYGNLFRFLDASESVPDATHVSASGDMAYGTGRASNEFGGPQGPVRYTGKYILVWRRVAGEWRIVLYGVSSDQPS
jgi:ketosteroid isomerase-like protein